MAMERENRPVRGAGKRRKKVCQFCVDKCASASITRTPLSCAASSPSAQDPAPPYHRHLRYASAPAHRGHQARPSDRPAALRDRVIV